MKASQILPLAMVLVPGVIANFQWHERDCEWFGSSPGCGGTGSSIGDFDDEGRELIMTTQHQDAADACERLVGYYSECREDYGNGCWTGYKRLWCYKFNPNP